MEQGYQSFKKGDYDQAIKDYSEAIKLDPEYAFPFYGRGCAWALKKDYDKAIKDLTEAIRLDPKNASAYNDRGGVFLTTGKYDKALKDYTEAIRLDPKHGASFDGRGWAWLKTREYDKAIEDCSGGHPTESEGCLSVPLSRRGSIQEGRVRQSDQRPYRSHRNYSQRSGCLPEQN